MLVKSILFIISLCNLIVIGTPMSLQAQTKQNKKHAIQGIPKEVIYEAEALFIEAEKHYILGDYEKALLLFGRVAKLNPTNGTVYYKMADIYSEGEREEDLIKASANIEEALTLEKKNKQFYLLAASVYTKMLNFSKATQVLERMLKEVENTEKYLYQLGRIYQYANKMNKAIQAYDRAEMFLGITEKSSLPKQQIYLKQKKIKEAVKELKKLVTAFPDEELYTLELAKTLSLQQRKEDATKVLNRFIATHTHAKKAMLLLVELYRKDNQEQKARLLLQKLFDNPAIDAESKLAMISFYIEKINRESMTKAVDTTLISFTLDLLSRMKKTHPHELGANIAGGDIYLALNRMEEAKREYQKAIQKGSNHFKVWQNMLYMESAMNQFDSLIVHSEKGLELFPDQAMFYYFNGYAYLRKHHYKQAAQSLEEAKKLSRSEKELRAEINELLGDVYNTLKEYKKSDDAFNEALLFNPDNSLVLNNYSYYLALRKDSLDKAERMAERVATNRPNDNAYLDTYAWVLFMQRKYKKAEEIMKSVIQDNPSNYVFFDHYGDILFKLGRVEEAVEQWKKAKTKGLNDKILDDKINNKKLR